MSRQGDCASSRTRTVVDESAGFITTASRTFAALLARSIRTSGNSAAAYLITNIRGALLTLKINYVEMHRAMVLM